MYTFIAEEQANETSDWSVAEMCRVLEVARSGYYDWVDRQPSDREISDRQLCFEINTIWVEFPSDRGGWVLRGECRWGVEFLVNEGCFQAAV